MGKGLIVVIVLVSIALWCLGNTLAHATHLVTKNEAVKSAWSQVDVVLQRRADLIPNLVETVKGIAQQEQTVFGDIAKARSALLSAGRPARKNCRQPATRWRAGTLAWPCRKIIRS